MDMGQLNEMPPELKEVVIAHESEKFSSLVTACLDKCVFSTKVHEDDLTKAESVCLDRCTAKFMEVLEKVGQELMEVGVG